MAGTGETGNRGGTTDRRPAGNGRSIAHAVGMALLAIAQPDLFGHAADPELAELAIATRRRRARIRRRAAAQALLAEPWAIDEAGAAGDAVALARRFLRRYPERDRPDPAPPLLTARQEQALWHAEEEIAEEAFRTDCW